MVAVTPAPRPAPSEAVVADLLGLLAQASLVGAQQASAASALAPAVDDRLALARLAGRRLAHLDALVAEVVRHGVAPAAALQPFVAPVDEFTRHAPATGWGEALVRLCVATGIAGDVAEAVRPGLGSDLAALVPDDDGTGDDAPARMLTRLLADDPANRDRLALYGRRLLAEALSQVQRIAVAHPGLTALLGGAGDEAEELAAVSRLMNDLAARHGRRLAELGLA